MLLFCILGACSQEAVQMELAEYFNRVVSYENDIAAVQELLKRATLLPLSERKRLYDEEARKLDHILSDLKQLKPPAAAYKHHSGLIALCSISRNFMLNASKAIGSTPEEERRLREERKVLSQRWKETLSTLQKEEQELSQRYGLKFE